MLETITKSIEFKMNDFVCFLKKHVHIKQISYFIIMTILFPATSKLMTQRVRNFYDEKYLLHLRILFRPEFRRRANRGSHETPFIAPRIKRGPSPFTRVLSP